MRSHVATSTLVAASLCGAIAAASAQTPAPGALGNLSPGTAEAKKSKDVTGGITTGIGPGQHGMPRSSSGRGNFGPANYSNVGSNIGGK
jgi:hypothetical protein